MENWRSCMAEIKTRKPQPTLSERVDKIIAAAGLPAPQAEYRFHSVRKWRFDRAWPEIRLALEIDGTGRHNTVAGMANDDEKINEAIIQGWAVLRVNAKLISATGLPGKGARKLPYEPLVSVLARAYQSRIT
jgi:hypothetical protein